jgi:hypothetical protein
MDRFKEMIKEPKSKASILLDSIKFKSEQRHGRLYLVDDQEDGMMYSFDTLGVCVEARQLTKEEKQTKLRAVKKTEQMNNEKSNINNVRKRSETNNYFRRLHRNNNHP